MPRSGVAGPYGSSVLNMSANWKIQQWPQGWKKSVFIPIPKKGNAKECSNCHTTELISHASKFMLKILQAKFQQHVNRQLPAVQAGFRKGRGNRDQIANIHSITEKAREYQKNIYFCFTDYAKTSDCHDWATEQVTKSCLTPCNLTDCSTAGSPILCYLLEFVQTHVHWFSDAISSPVTPFSSCPQSFPASGSFPMSQLFESMPKILKLKLQWIFRVDFLWDWLVWSPWSPRDPQESSSEKLENIISLRSAFFMVQLSHLYMTTGNTIALIIWTFVGKVMSLLFNMLSRLVITSSNEQASFNFMAAVTICSDFGAKKSLSLFPLFPHLFAMKWWDQIPWS